MSEAKLTAFVLGATGAVGKQIVQVLSADDRFSKVTLIGRRPVALNSDQMGKFENKLIDFDKLQDYSDVFQGHDVGFSSLGARSWRSSGFYKVDHDYVIGTAKLAKAGGCRHVHLVSAASANKNAWMTYSKTKGEVEEELTSMGFPRLSIYRPGILLTNGGREDTRAGEAVLQCLLKPLDRRRWWSVRVDIFAKAMVARCFEREADLQTEACVEIFGNGDIDKLGRREDSSKVKNGAAASNKNKVLPAPSET